MKKAFAILLALALVLSLSTTAFAAGNGSITITNATPEQTYDVYKFFDATYATDDEGNLKLDSEGKPIVSYTIDPDNNQFYENLFGADGKTDNPYFDHDAETHFVTKKGTASDKDIIAYLDGLAANAQPDFSSTASSEVVEFTGLDTGYYLIDRGPASVVTLTTNMPAVQIIDKNQKPGSGFDKLVDSASASIGDIVNFEIPFTATNYDGEEKVLYYTIHDLKSSALWVEFNTVSVQVGDLTLDRGYYFFAGPVGDDAETGEWSYLGNWEGITETPNNAQWYLIHYGYDEFEIIIPWMQEHIFEGNDLANTFELKYPETTDGSLPAFRYDATESVVLNYSASVGPDAVNVTVGNEATLSWKNTDGPSGSGDVEKTETKVYNLGITKIANDSAKTRLTGAIFELYSDADCTDPIYVIPTGVDGVYILDDVDTNVSGYERITVREAYDSEDLRKWLAADPNPDADGTPRRNDMVTPANGQIVVLGLESGTYYLMETEAPAGYNKLALPVELTVGEGPVSTYDSGYQVYGMNVVNNQGVELPSTGGEGTVLLITIGTMIAMAFAVLLITQKKMSIYRD